MGIFGTVLGICGFGVGISIGLVVGYFLFIFFQPSHVKNPQIRPLVEEDSESLMQIINEIPLWVKNPDFDRVDWLTKFIACMWPYLDKAICKMVRNVAEPIIAEQIPKYNVDSVEFEELTLGSLPPTFQGSVSSFHCGDISEATSVPEWSRLMGMKVSVTDEKELIMEPSIKWAGNPNIMVAIKAFGVKVTVQVVDLQIFAAPRITLKPLVPSFPCFAKIFVCLMEKPHVDFGLKLIGADLMSIPGLYRFVQELIKDQVANMYLWPKTLEVTIMDPQKASMKPVGILNVKVLRAMKLKKKDLLGTSDPYVKLNLTENQLPSKKTTVKHRNLNPEWNEEFHLVVKDPQSQALELHVYDWEQVGKHDKMGMNVVPLKDLSPDEPKSMTLDLLKNMDSSDASNAKNRGQVFLELTYKPFKDEDLRKGFDETSDLQKAPDGTPPGGGLLVVSIHEAQDVEGKNHTNPYARLVFRGEKRKTKRVNKNRNPRWEQEFEFMLDDPPTADKIHVEVRSVSSRIGLLRPKESLGYVDIHLSDVVTNKRMNEKYYLINSKNGRIQVELKWRT